MAPISPAVRDWKVRTANTALMYLYALLLACGVAVSALPPSQSAPMNRGRKSNFLDEAQAFRLTYANAALDGASLLYVLIFLVMNRYASVHHIPVWGQILALLVIFGWSIGMSIPIWAWTRYEPWYRAVAVMNWLQAGMAAIFIGFLAIYTKIHAGGFRARFAPLAAEAEAARKSDTHAHPSKGRDRGAHIALIVLLVFLDLFVLASFIMGCVETSDIWENYAHGLNGGHITCIILLAVFWVWITIHFCMRSTAPYSPAGWVRTDVIIFTAFGVILIAMAGVSLGLILAEISYMGPLTTILTFAAGGFTLVIALFESIYTAVHGGEGKWRRRFATPVAAPESVAEDVELATAVPSARSSSVGKKERGEDTCNLNYA